jgi:protein phosphatase 1 regulatory subunit 37
VDCLFLISRGRSRIWVEEEGEVFRKGTHLLTPEHLEGDYDAEELRKEVCPLIARCLQRQFIDDCLAVGSYG